MLVARLASKAEVVRIARAALGGEVVTLPLEGVPSGSAQVTELRADGLRETICVEVELAGVPTDEGCPVVVRPRDDMGYGELLGFVARNEGLISEEGEAEEVTPEASEEAPNGEDVEVTTASEVSPVEDEGPAAEEDQAEEATPTEPPVEPVSDPVVPHPLQESGEVGAEPESALADEAASDALGPEDAPEAADSEPRVSPRISQLLAIGESEDDLTDSYDEHEESEAPEEDPSAAVQLREEDAGFIKFFGGLTAAVARTGYYDKDHPEVLKQVHPLGEATRHILEGRGELSIVRRGMGDKAELVIWEPTTGEAVGLDELLPVSSATVMGERMTEFFVRRRLMALTLKAGIQDKELIGVLDLLSGAEADVKDLREQFLKLSLDYVSALFEEDRLGIERTLPWHVELCISRVARDLRALPIFRGADDETIRKMRVQLVADVVRPLQDPELLTIMLQNSDLIADVVEKSEDDGAWFDPAEVICEALAQPVAVKVAGCLLDRLEDQAIARREGAATEPGESSTKPDQLIHLLAGRFMDDRSVESDEVLRELHGRAVLSFHELPADLKLWIQAGALCDDLVKNAKQALQAIEKLDNDAFAHSVPVLSRAVQVLSQREEYETFGLLYDWVVERANRVPASEESREGQVAMIRDKFADAPLLVPMASAFLKGDSKLKMVARRMLIFAENHGAEALCRARVLAIDEEIHRPGFVGLVREMGDVAVPALARALTRLSRDPKARDPNVEDLLRALPNTAHGKAGACAPPWRS